MRLGMLGMRLTAKMALSPNLKTSLCLSRGKVDANAFWAAEAAGPCGSHIPDTQHPMMLLKCGPRAFLTVFAQDLRAWWLASRTRLSLSWCERDTSSKWAELTTSRGQPCGSPSKPSQLFVCLLRSGKPQLHTFLRTMAAGMWSGCQTSRLIQSLNSCHLCNYLHPPPLEQCIHMEAN